MSNDKGALAAAAEVVRTQDDFLVTTHHGPDGDAIGSLLAMHALLEAHGKQHVLYNADGVPDGLSFLPGADNVVDQVPDRRFAWTILLDCGMPDRVGHVYEEQAQYTQALVLDHHLTERDFGDVAYVDSDAAATGEIVYRLANAMGWTPTPDFASCAYAALLTDTGSFQFNNTNARVLKVASELAALGADPARIAEAVFSGQSKARVAMMGNVLESLRYYCGDRVAITSVRKNAMQQAGATKYDLEGLVNIPRSIAGVLVAVQIKEVDVDREYRVSLRSKPPVSVEAIARQFGGGGHRYAAGCTLEGTYDQVLSQLVAAIETALLADAG